MRFFWTTALALGVLLGAARPGEAQGLTQEPSHAHVQRWTANAVPSAYSLPSFAGGKTTDAVRWLRAHPEQSNRFRFGPTLGGAALGAAIGGGLGALVGDIDLDEVRRDDGPDENRTLPAVLPGILLGTTVGALAGARAEPSGPAVAYAVGGGVLGGLGGLLLGAAVSGGDRTAAFVGAGAGASLGASGMVQVARDKEHGLVAHDADGWSVQWPTVRRIPDPLAPGTAPRITLTRVRL